MVFLVHLKGKDKDDPPDRVDADNMLAEDGVYQFSKKGEGMVASYPVAEVSKAVKE